MHERVLQRNKRKYFIYRSAHSTLQKALEIPRKRFQVFDIDEFEISFDTWAKAENYIRSKHRDHHWMPTYFIEDTQK